MTRSPISRSDICVSSAGSANTNTPTTGCTSSPGFWAAWVGQSASREPSSRPDGSIASAIRERTTSGTVVANACSSWTVSSAFDPNSRTEPMPAWITRSARAPAIRLTAPSALNVAISLASATTDTPGSSTSGSPGW